MGWAGYELTVFFPSTFLCVTSGHSAPGGSSVDSEELLAGLHNWQHAKTC